MKKKIPKTVNRPALGIPNLYFEVANSKLQGLMSPFGSSD